MIPFSSSVNLFLTQNQFNNNLDDFGNIVLNAVPLSASQEYINIPLMQYEYDNSVIENLYDVNINTQNVSNQQQILVVNQDLQNSYNTAIVENQALKNSLGDLIAIVEANPAQAESMAQKDLIINLRIQLGQGKTSSDFSPDFPYAPL
jgi:hypothetical protein